uniref:Transcription factor domain-containing protein n=1 Tax=Kwoniella dejecticola CBS 10117 TaxID=1296121 RepID=A0A1A6A8L6_9TREE|nr:uncharacterized protein I303_04122 [Kwoniella dejecticola CBS 10117]OBR86398.1 hypothetical protein I303_04122 [Kwoniella dejecticola CBS 10117]
MDLGSPVGGITQYPVPFPQDDPLLLHHLRSGCPDPVKAGLMSDADADGMFDFYFQHLNAILAILDPNLHSANYCRQKSTLLYSSVLTVTTKVVRPKIYARCMMLTNKLVGQAVEFGLCSVHIVQALNLLHHWKKSDDHTSWRRMGYAIRMAQELRLDIKSSRPLPSEDLIAREMLNKERAWLSDLAIHHSLPRMIHTQDVDDPADWVADHPRFAIPGESSLGPLITFSRMCRFYADNLDTKNRESETRTLHWLEVEWARWRNRWLANNERFQFTQSQLATFRLCDAYFCFHIAEYRLLATARHNHTKDHIDLNRPSALSSAFSKSVEAALGIAIVIQKDLAPYGFLPYCFYLTWVAMAVTAIWLVKNIAPMSQEDRVRVIGLLTEVQFSIEEASRSSDDMAAYTNRLLKHLLNGVSPEWQLASFLSNSEVPQDSQQISETSVASMVAAPEWTAPTAAMWEPFSAQDIIQNQLWSQHTNAEPSLHPLNLLETGRNGPSQQAQQDEAMPGSQADIPAVPNEVGGFLFPTDDDDFWYVFKHEADLMTYDAISS